MSYVWNVLLGLDKFGNTIIGGDPDETISARSGRLRESHPYTWGVLAKALGQVQTDHSEKAIVDDRNNAEKEVVREDEAIAAGQAEPVATPSSVSSWEGEGGALKVDVTR